MPNHYTNMIILLPGGNGDARPLLEGLRAPEFRSLLAQHGGYDMAEPVVLPGDPEPVLLTFASKWGAPMEKDRVVVVEYLSEFGVMAIRWTGINPQNDSFEDIGVWEFPL